MSVTDLIAGADAYAPLTELTADPEFTTELAADTASRSSGWLSKFFGCTTWW